MHNFLITAAGGIKIRRFTIIPFKRPSPWAVLALCFFCFTGCVSKSSRIETSLNITSHPSVALCSLHQCKKEHPGKQIVVCGTTPVQSSAPSNHNIPLWLRVEKRGYKPFVQQVMPGEQLTLDVKLESADSSKCRIDSGNPPGAITKIAVLMPRIAYILRGTFSNETETDISRVMGEAAARSITQTTDRHVPARLAPQNPSNSDTIRSLWRDSRTAMAVVDPIRMAYFTCPATLETRSGRQNAMAFGKQQKADAVLIISGRIDRESASLVFHKSCFHALGTASSYAAGYNTAVSSGHSSFFLLIHKASYHLR